MHIKKKKNLLDDYALLKLILDSIDRNILLCLPEVIVFFLCLVMGSISDSDLPRDILSSLRHQAKGRSQLGRISERLSVDLKSHKKSVNTIQWSPTHG